jgi:hypothetical protein
MARATVVRLLTVGILAGLAACGDREPPPPAEAEAAPAPIESPPPVTDSLRGDSIMVRDTARIPG